MTAPPSLASLVRLRVVLVTGKGGVGKTTVAASLARSFAASGKRVLCTEIAADEAATSPLAEAFGMEQLRDEPTDVGPNLRVASLVPVRGHQRFLRDVLPVRILADAALRSAAIRRFLAAAPTFPEMGVLYRLLELARAKRRDGTPEHASIVVDLPATGHALALAQVPHSLLRVVPSGPIATAMREGLALLGDPEQTGAVVVTLPETLPVTEALELAAGIEENGIPLAHVVVNRVPFDPFGPEERRILDRLLADRPPMLGARTIERIDRARVAVARVSGAVRVPVTVLHDVWLEGPRLAEEMASMIAVHVEEAR